MFNLLNTITSIIFNKFNEVIMNFLNNTLFQSLKNSHIKTLIELHIKDYVDAYNLDTKKLELEQEYLLPLGKGNAKRKKFIYDNQKYIDNPQISEYDK